MQLGVDITYLLHDLLVALVVPVEVRGVDAQLQNASLQPRLRYGLGVFFELRAPSSFASSLVLPRLATWRAIFIFASPSASSLP